MQIETVFAGFGGQGVLLAGRVLAEVGMKLGREVVWLPSYGPEMRGGTANCVVIIADEPIASPVVAHTRDVVVMNRPSLEKFCPVQQPGGFTILNSSLINIRPERNDINVVEVPANEIAIEAGSGRAANMVMLGAYVGATGIAPLEAVLEQVRVEFEQKAKLIPINIKCVEQGFEVGRQVVKSANK